MISGLFTELNQQIVKINENGKIGEEKIAFKRIIL